MRDNAPVVVAENLSKRFKIYPRPNARLVEWISGKRLNRHVDFWALRDVSLSVSRGECLGIVGENGSGKSTLLKILTGAQVATSGTSRIDGRVLALIELGTGFNSQLTGAENIRLAAQLLALDDDYVAKRFDDIVAFASIGEFIDRPIKLYSSGMLVRLAFSLFAFLEPEVLIVDEALSVGDAAFQRKCYRRMEEMITSQERAVVLVTHDTNAVTKFCTRAIWLDQGRVRMSGAPVAVVEAYLKQVLGRHEVQQPEGQSQAPATAVAIAGAAATEDLAIPAAGFLPHTEAAVIYPSDGLQLLGAWLEDPSGRVLSYVPLHAAFRICYALKFQKRHESPIFGLRVSTIRGDTLVATNTKMSGMRTREYEPGDVETIRWPIRPGLSSSDYFLSIGCVRNDAAQTFILREVDSYFFSVRGSGPSGALCSLTQEPILGSPAVHADATA